jgi:Protein of unknown function (DUF2933)
MKTSITPSQAPACATGTPWYRNPLWLGLGVVGMLAVVLYASGHLGRAASYWPYLLLLACPLMHLFMCRGKKEEAGSAAPGPADSVER